MNILVTGAAGFIGSNVCRVLSQSHNIIGVDNFNSYYNPSIKKQRIATLQKKKGFTFIKSSFWNTTMLIATQKKYKPDIIIHTAAEVGVRNGEIHALSYIRTNTLGTATLLETIGSSVRHIVLFSSSSVYGNAVLPFKETSPTNPLSIYGVSKLNMERHAMYFFTKSATPITIVRPFSVYGPNGRPDMLPIKLLLAATHNKPIFITGNSTLRDWTYIDDIAHAVAIISQSPKKLEVVNLGLGKPLTNEFVLQTAQRIIKTYGHSLSYAFRPHGPAESEATCADVTKLKRLYGIRFKTPFVTGFQNTAEFFFSHKNLYAKT